MAQISKPKTNNVAELSKHAADQAADAARDASSKTEEVARSSLTDLQKGTTATLEAGQAMAGRTGQDTKEFGHVLSQLFNEQAQHNLKVFTQLTRTFSLAEAAQIQADFLRASMDRSVQFTRRYFETAQATMFSAMAKMPTDQASTSRR
jgi:ribosomal protein S3